MFPIITKLTGVSFQDAQENINKFGGPGLCAYELVREPDNPHDPNAIRVALFGDIFLGYVPKHIAGSLARMMDNGRSFVAEFYRINKSPVHKTVGVTVRIVEIVQQQKQRTN